MALGKTYQTYRQKVIENIGLEKEAEIQEQISEEKLPEVRDKMAEEKLLCYEPISKRYFHATEVELTLPNEPRLCSGWRDIHEQPL